jgi:hypothetical protein
LLGGYKKIKGRTLKEDSNYLGSNFKLRAVKK